MATVISVEAVRASSLRVTWQWVDVGGLVHGPNVTHIAVGSDAQAWADAAEAADIVSQTELEIAQNLEEIAG